MEETAELLRSLGDVGNSVVPRYFGGIAEEARRVPHRERLERRTKGYARMGAPYRGALMKRIRADEARHTARIGRLFADHDVLLTPVAASPPVEVGRWEGLGAARTFAGQLLTYPFAAVWNATGQPAAAVPAGLSGDGLPLSVQLVGRPDDEATLLSLAAQIESERPWADRRPPVS